MHSLTKAFSSRRKVSVRRGRQMLIKTDPQKFLSIVHLPDSGERISKLGWIDDILLGEIVRFGIYNDVNSIPDLWGFDSKVVDEEMPIALRQLVFEEVKHPGSSQSCPWTCSWDRRRGWARD